MGKNEKLLNNTIVIAIGTFTTKLLSFLLIPFYTLWLSPEEYGSFDLLVTYVSFIVPFVTFQLEQALFRFCMEKKECSKKYFSNAIQIILFNMLICNLLLLFIMNKNKFFVPFILYFNVYTIFLYLLEYLRGNSKLKLYSLVNIIVSVSIVISNIIFVYFLKYQVMGMLISYVVSYVIGTIIIVFKEELFKISIKKHSNKEIKQEMINYSLPLIPNCVSWWIINVSDRTIINYFLGSFYNGIYAVSCKIPLIVNLVFSVFNLSWQQTAIETLHEKDKKEYYDRLYYKLIIFLYSSAFCILIASKFLFRYIFSIEYYEGMDHIPFLLNGVVFLSLAQFLSGIFLAQKDTKNVGISTVWAAIINIVINLLAIKFIGLYAASLSTMISYIVMFVGRFLKLKELFAYKRIIKKILIYNMLFFIIVGLLMLNSLVLEIVMLLCAIIFFIIVNIELEKSILKKVLGR